MANACFDPAVALLMAGFTTTGVYDDGSALTGDMTITETTTCFGNETVTVFGRSFNTCKYVRNTVPGNGSASTISAISTVWRILGKGVVVRLEATSAGTTTVLQFKSGTLNGMAL